MNRIFICVFFVFVHWILLFPEVYSQSINHPKQKSKQVGKTKKRYNSFHYYKIADSCSRVGDSICASINILKVNPYIFLFEELTPATIDTYLRHHFKLTRKASQKYHDTFTSVYMTPKSNSYEAFRAMGNEDQLMRSDVKALIYRFDSYNWAEKTRQADSVHFAYLYSYVINNGWPSLADGSMYAGILAIHDHRHHKEYIPYLEKAVAVGQADPSLLNLVYYWKESIGFNNILKNVLAKKKYFKIDVSDMLDNNDLSDSTFNRIVNITKKYCPIKFIYTFEHQNNNEYVIWSDKLKYIYRRVAAISKLSVALAEYNCKISTNELFGLREGFYQTFWDSSWNDHPKLMMYIFHEKEENTGQDISFDEIKTKGSFVTHAIQFDVNEHVIKQESNDFIIQLAEWLKENKQIKLQIEGHTDNDGDSLANLRLSHARANEVRKQLFQFGVDSSRIFSKGFGENRPIKSNSTIEGKAANRRVEFISK